MIETLPDTLFRTILQHAPLIAIDLCVVTAKQNILIGYRKNRPARDNWFVPGGRIRKAETLSAAFRRISQQELGLTKALEQGAFLGTYEHFYPDNFYDESFGTHYIVLAYMVTVDTINFTELPAEQHNRYRLVALGEFERDPSIHKNSRAYIGALKSKLGENQSGCADR